MAYTTIDDPSAYFQVATWSGNGSNQTITNDGNSDLQPDWLWIKSRNEISEHQVIDSTRGLAKRLHTDTNEAETNDINATISSLNSDGFTMTQYNAANGSSDTGVGWQWKANGGTTSSNTDGTITSTVQANTTAGFSVVTYTGTGSNATVGHGLGATPKVVIVKNRTDAADWFVYHGSLGTPVNEYLQLNNTNAKGSNSGTWNSNPTSSVFGLGSTFGAVNGSSKNYVAYVFAEKQGYSKFGSYTGNGSTDGTFVYTGFKPAWVMIRRTDLAKNWYMFDSVRNTFNVIDDLLAPNLSDAETSGTGTYIDFLSNGFKLRQDFSHMNASGGTHIYMAFAESPFVSSEGVPTTAR